MAPLPSEHSNSTVMWSYAKVFATALTLKVHVF